MFQKLNTYRKLGISNILSVALYVLEKKAGLHQKRMPVTAFSDALFFRGDRESVIPAQAGIHGSVDSRLRGNDGRKSGNDKSNERSIEQQAKNLLAGRLTFFSHQNVETATPPQWRCNLEGYEVSPAQQHWSTIPDFNPAVGDIKNVWEPSRFDWLLVFTRAYRETREARYLDAMNHWLQDWCHENPVNGGPNWKCGQEASLRMMQILLAAYLLNEHLKPEPMLVEFVVAHCRRIAPTLRYAMAQDNNHGTSEAAALFIAGYWLDSVSSSVIPAQAGIHGSVDSRLRGNDGGISGNDSGISGDDNGISIPASGSVGKELVSTQEIKNYQKLGRKWLENRAKKLIEKDGSFSQQSVNYHRVMLDTFSLAEFWRVQLNAPPLSNRFYQQAKAATQWLQTMTHPATGDVPNLGANDGARLFALTETDYRDFRPSVQLAAALFFDKVAYGEGPWNDQLRWLGLPIPEQHLPDRASKLFDQGGYCFLKNEASDLQLLVRYPRFRFRPSHADALHLDLWWKGLNIIRDGGTFSYNTDDTWLNYFPGTESHSTVQFDDRDQMPRISRFLFGNWLKPDFVEAICNEENGQVWSTQYTDCLNATHKRTVRLESGKLVITDNVKDFKDKAVLRWRLMPGEWVIQNFPFPVIPAQEGIHRTMDSRLRGNDDGILFTAASLKLDNIILSVNANTPIKRFELLTGYESRYYNEKTTLPVLEIEFDKDCVIETVLDFAC